MVSWRRPGLAAAAIVAVNGVIASALFTGAGVQLMALAVVAPLAVALTRRPQVGLLVLAALLPFDGLLLLAPRLPQIAAGWKEALVLGTLLATFLAPPSARPGAPGTLPGWVPAAGGLLVLGLASAVVVGGLQAAWGLKIGFFFVLVAVIVWRCPLDAGERDALVTILIVTGFATAVYGLAQQALGPAGLHALGYEYNSAIRTTKGFLRSISSFDNPFAFGYFLMLVVLVGVPHSFAQPDRLRSRLFMLALPVFLVALAGTFVRGAWVGLLAGLAYLGIARFPRVLLVLPVVAVGLLLLPGGVSSAAFSSSSGVERVAGWQDKLSDVTRHPLGVGLGSSNAAAEKVAAASGGRGADGVFHPDNEYYRALYELGILGLWFTVLLLISAFLSARATSVESLASDGGVFAVAVASTVVGAAAASLVATYFDTFPNNVYFWLLLGVVATERMPRSGRAVLSQGATAPS
jgi:putative inorganic carbon (HCO3(-)) transporter